MENKVANTVSSVKKKKKLHTLYFQYTNMIISVGNVKMKQVLLFI